MTAADASHSKETDAIPYDDMPPYICRMWQRIGRSLEALACDRAAAASGAADAYQAAEIAKIAEGCLWQSMGDADAFGLQNKARGETP